MKAYTIIAGVNGVGKSSLTGILKAEHPDLGYVIDVDRIVAESNLGTLDAVKVALTEINNLLSTKMSFAHETSLSDLLVEKTVKIAKEKGYHVRLFYIGLNTQDECKKRIKNRVLKGGHDIPDDTVEYMFSSRFDLLQAVLPYCDDAKLFDTLDSRFVADLVLQILSYVSEKERENIKKRQQQGIDVMPVIDGKRVSTKTGRPLGRPSAVFPDGFIQFCCIHLRKH